MVELDNKLIKKKNVEINFRIQCGKVTQIISYLFSTYNSVHAFLAHEPHTAMLNDDVRLIFPFVCLQQNAKYHNY